MKLIFIFLRKHFVLEEFISTTLSLIFVPKLRFVYFAYLCVLYDYLRSRSLHDDFFQPWNAEVRNSRSEISNSSQIWIWISMGTEDNDFVTKRGLLTLGTWVYIEIWRFPPPFFFYFDRNVETSIRIEIKRRSPSFDLNTQKFS